MRATASHSGPAGKRDCVAQALHLWPARLTDSVKPANAASGASRQFSCWTKCHLSLVASDASSVTSCRHLASVMSPQKNSCDALQGGESLTSSSGSIPTSVALCPGGFAEASFARTNKVILSKRLGFIRLAFETGAQLVPVLGIGEEHANGAAAGMVAGCGRLVQYCAAVLLLPAKPCPLHVSSNHACS